MISLVVVSSAAARASIAARISGARRTGTTSAGPAALGAAGTTTICANPHRLPPFRVPRMSRRVSQPAAASTAKPGRSAYRSIENGSVWK